MKYTIEMVSCGMLHLPSFMKTGKGMQAVLRFCISNLNGCNVGVTG
jgi:hypothetical protein